MGEVPVNLTKDKGLYDAVLYIQGYLTYKKTHPPRTLP